MEGVVRAPSAFSMTLVLPPSMTATQELVVPRSMPMILLIISLPQKKLTCLRYGIGVPGFKGGEAVEGEG